MVVIIIIILLHLDNTSPFTNESWYSTNVTVNSAQYTGPYYVATNSLANDSNPGQKLHLSALSSMQPML